MSRWLLALSVPLCLFATGCGGDTEPTAPIAACTEIRISEMDYVMPVPAGATVDIGDADVRITVDPMARAPKVITLRRKVPGSLPAHSISRETAMGGELLYAVERMPAVGSGGSEAGSFGVLEFGPGLGPALAFVCSCQSEGTCDPTWCFETLDRLAPLGSPGACS